MMMKIAATRGKCGIRAEMELEPRVETSNFRQAFLLLAEKYRHHTHSGENFGWRLGWSEVVLRNAKQEGIE